MSPGGNPSRGDGNPQQKITEEQAIRAAYRESLEDAVALLEGLSSVCFSLEEMVDMLRLAIRNDSQLELVRSKVTPKGLRGR